MYLNFLRIRCIFFYLITFTFVTISSLKAQTFERVENVAGLGVIEKNNGLAVADFNQDGHLDVFVVARDKDVEGDEATHSRLFQNNNNGTFTDVTTSSGLTNLLPISEETPTFRSGISGHKSGAFWGDYDNDGYPDLFLTNTSKVQLFHNEKNGKFVDVTDFAGLKKYNGCLNTSATWFDYNNDGLLDLYICVWSETCNNVLYKNNGDGTFSDTSNLFPTITNKLSHQAMPYDFNNDGWMDLYVSNDYYLYPNNLFINDKGLGFTDQASNYGMDHLAEDMGIAMCDYNNDGSFEFYTTAILENAFYTKTSDNKYSDIAQKLGIDKTGWAWDVNFSDFDLDGDEDLFVVNGFVFGTSSSDYNFYYENVFANGEYKFVNKSKESKLGDLTISVSEGVFDYDNDGDLDILVTNNDRKSYLYENKITDFTNPRTDLHWLKVSLQGTNSNRDAIGTKISIKTSQGYLYRYYNGVGYLSQSLKQVHFGLGAANKILDLKVVWPSGLVENFQNVPIDKNILLKEGSGITVLSVEPSKKVYGCTDANSCNFNPYATKSSGDCAYLKSDVIIGNKNVLHNSIETYTYNFPNTSTVQWQVVGGKIIEGYNSSTLKVQWGYGDKGEISLIEKNTQCTSEKKIFIVELSSIIVEGVSVARQWNEALLAAIRKDFARPTVHARNLFHTSVAMYDAWAVFDSKAKTYLLGNEVHGFKSEFKGFTTIENTVEARNKAISYAAYRLLTHRFSKSPGKVNSQANFDALMVKLGYDIANTSLDYSTGEAAALGNYIAQTVIDYGHVDGSNEANQYKNIFYQPSNQPMNLLNPSEYPITSIDPNRWQPLKFDSFIDQSGNLIPGSTPNFLSPEWGNVFPFSLKETDKMIYDRLGHSYNVFHDPGTPPVLSLEQNTKASEAYKWGFSMVSKWSSHLDPKDGVRIDISPKSLGNISLSMLPKSYLEYPNFYNALQGGDIGKGYLINPSTKQPYTEQKVLRGDYTRVLAEFWADGPNSETPPGHWFSILNYVSDSKLFKKRFNGQGEILNNLEWDVKSYFVLGGAMHDCAITAWGIKGWYDYIRPISAIRYMASKGQSTDPNLPNYNVAGMPLEPGFIEVVREGDPLAGPNNENIGKIKLYAWKGHSQIKDPNADVAGTGWILAENWWPYQRPSFVTPPFAGYISGHSTYSRAGAEIMTMLTGDAYFPGGMGEFIAHKNEFLVFEEGPSEDVKLQWATYRDASDQCSLSRIWGGIHPPQDDIPGRLIGEKIAKEVFAYSLPYFTGQIIEPANEPLDVMAYPNPVHDELTINFGTGQNNKEITLYDMKGKQVLNTNTTESVIKINVETLSVGVYLLHINSVDVNYERLIIKK